MEDLQIKIVPLLVHKSLSIHDLITCTSKYDMLGNNKQNIDCVTQTGASLYISIQGVGPWAIRITQMRKCRRYWLMPSNLCPRSRPSANLSTEQPACATAGHSKHRYGHRPAEQVCMTSDDLTAYTHDCYDV